MDIQPQSTQPISDDQELAKVLAGVNADADTTDDDSSDTPAMSQITAPVAPGTPPPVAPAVDDAAAPVAEPAVAAEPIVPEPVVPEPVVAPEPIALPEPPMPEPVAPMPAAPAGELDAVKQDAITELRPLVDKLTLAPEEKFDTYLLLIRSTDDKSLIAPAHEAAKSIADETRRAQALLDIIKEIDFLAGQQA